MSLPFLYACTYLALLTVSLVTIVVVMHVVSGDR